MHHSRIVQKIGEALSRHFYGSDALAMQFTPEGYALVRELRDLVTEAERQAQTEARHLISEEFRVYRQAISYAVTALEGSSDNGDRYCAHQLRFALDLHTSET